MLLPKRSLRKCLMILRRHICVAGLMACGADSIAPDDPAPAVQATTLALEVSPGSATIAFGSTLTLTATKRMSDGSRRPVNPSWVSNDPTVVTIDANGFAVAVGVGGSRIDARIDGLSASSFIVVTRPPSTGTSDALIVEEFSMMEYQNPYALEYWLYVPQLRVRSAPGRTVKLVLIDFLIPGLGAIPSWNCDANIPSTRTSELNGEVYGSWTLEIQANRGVRAGSGTVRAVLTFVDDSAVIATTSVDGKVVPGGWPSTYTGGNLGGSCFRGYRPPG